MATIDLEITLRWFEDGWFGAWRRLTLTEVTLAVN